MAICNPKLLSPSLITSVICLCLVGFAQCDLSCVVDQCKVCRYANDDSCERCESGFYLVSFFSEDRQRPYHACWAIWKAVLRWIFAILLLLSYLYCCWLAWKKGKNVTRIENTKLDKKIIQDNTQAEDNNVILTTTGEEQVVDNNPQINIAGGTTGPPQVNLAGRNNGQTMHISQLPNRGIQPPNTIQMGQGQPLNSQYISQTQMQGRPVAMGSQSMTAPGLRNTITPVERRITSGPVSNFSQGDITIIRERPTTIIRELNPENDPRDYYGHTNTKVRPGQASVNVYANPRGEPPIEYSKPPRRLF